MLACLQSTSSGFPRSGSANPTARTDSPLLRYAFAWTDCTHNMGQQRPSCLVPPHLIVLHCSQVPDSERTLVGPLHKGYYRGHCLAGDDILEAVMTLEEAIEWSSKNPQCFGFTYNSVERDFTGPTRIWFKSKLNVLYNEKWWTYSTGLGTPVPSLPRLCGYCGQLLLFDNTLRCTALSVCSQAWTRGGCATYQIGSQSATRLHGHVHRVACWAR